MKKAIITICLMLVIMFSSGCHTKVEEELSIGEVKPLVLTVGDKLDFRNIELHEDCDFLVQTNDGTFAIGVGSTLVTCNGKDYFLTVNPKKPEIVTKANQRLKIGENTKIIANLNTRSSLTNFTYKSTDENVIKVDKEGTVTAVKDGMARIIINETLNDVSKELTFLVLEKDEEYYEDILQMIVDNEQSKVDLNTTKGMLDALINYNEYSLIGVSGYKQIGHFILPPEFGSGIIYKMDVKYKDGSIIKDAKDLEKLNDIKEFDYYVITNRHLIQDANKITVYIGPNSEELPATLLQYDDKIDLAVIKFTSKFYFPTAKFGNSDEVEKGEFIISMGNGLGKDDFRSHSFGVVSSPKRYVNTDTDGDRVNDWDSEYIQHDASLNECDSGGAIINMKGEIIGINSTKVVRNAFNNMAFAIPSNLVLYIANILEQGIRPVRALLGVSIIDVSAYQTDSEQFLAKYPYLKIPEDLKYGFYVVEIVPGGVCDKAKVMKNDIIVGFNGVELKYSYQIRAELGKFIVGSGAKTTIDVLRNNKKVTLEVVF